MIAKGLLVRNEQGHEFLLTTGSSLLQGSHELVVTRKVRNQWVLVEGTEAPEIREHLMGALLEFFAGLCRTLNDSNRAKIRAPARSRKGSKPRHHQPHESTIGQLRRAGD